MEGWGPGQEKESPMGKRGNVTFVLFVSPGCSRNVRLLAGSPSLHPLGHPGVEPWHWALVSFLHSQPQV